MCIKILRNGFIEDNRWQTSVYAGLYRKFHIRMQARAIEHNWFFLREQILLGELLALTWKKKNFLHEKERMGFDVIFFQAASLRLMGGAVSGHKQWSQCQVGLITSTLFGRKNYERSTKKPLRRRDVPHEHVLRMRIVGRRFYWVMTSPSQLRLLADGGSDASLAPLLDF